MNGEIFENEYLHVYVPDGWKCFGATDSKSEVIPKKIFVYKNAENEFDIFTKTGVTICFFGEDDYYLSPKIFYDNVEEIEEFELGKLWGGYTCTSLGYPYLMLECHENNTVFQIMILLQNENEKISITDDDVRDIIRSISALKTK